MSELMMTAATKHCSLSLHRTMTGLSGKMTTVARSASTTSVSLTDGGSLPSPAPRPPRRRAHAPTQGEDEAEMGGAVVGIGGGIAARSRGMMPHTRRPVDRIGGGRSRVLGAGAADASMNDRRHPQAVNDS
jgi:hypothetical protein